MEDVQKKQLLIIGAGGHGHVSAEVAEALGYQVSFLDDHNPRAVGKLTDLENRLPYYDAVFVAIGNNALREKITDEVESLGGSIATLIHPTAYVSPSANISKGTIIAPKAIVHTHSSIGKGCILSAGAIVDHDVTVESFVHLNAGSVCKAGSNIKKGQKVDSGEVVSGF